MISQFNENKRKVTLNMSIDLYDYYKEKANSVGTPLSSYMVMILDMYKSGLETSKNMDKIRNTFDDLLIQLKDKN
jgi:hypothetical protein